MVCMAIMGFSKNFREKTNISSGLFYSGTVYMAMMDFSKNFGKKKLIFHH